jgi:hypothetical protein
MVRNILVLILVLVLSVLTAVAGQKTLPVTPQQFGFCPQHSDVLYCFLPIFGLHNIIDAGLPFSIQEPGIFRLNSELGIGTTTIPLPSPASGVSYTFNPTMGTFVPSQESLGPILSDRADTMGAHRLYVAFTYQHFGFHSLDGDSLKTLVVGFADSVNLSLDEFTTFVSYGITRRVDISAAFPVRTVQIGASGLGFDVSLTPPATVTPVADTEARSASGLSDITLRVKANVWKSEHAGVAIAADIRTPTGQPLNFLGSGAFGVKPFVIASAGKNFHHLYIGPHVNVGYEWNGTSILGGALLGEEGRLPRVLSYTAGTEIGVHKRATVTLDLNGQRLFNVNHTYIFNDSLNPTSVTIFTQSINMKDASIGAKINPIGNLLLTGNLSFQLDRGGLRARLVPLIGASYTF